ncbi:MAG: 4Fe-4S binding protein [Candidatus Woesearchaeota archaeon]
MKKEKYKKKVEKNKPKKLKSWKEIPIGGVIEEAGNSINYETGSWRTFRPVINSEKCIGCMLCYLYCPESTILLENDEKFVFKVRGFDLEHCKGCGICASVCPVKAIEMKLESDFKKEDKSKEEK